MVYSVRGLLRTNSDTEREKKGEGSFLFYNPDVWTGNFRISAFKGNATYGRDAVRQELKENESASLVKVGALESAYSKEMFQEEGKYYTSHLWITGIGNIAFECSFTVPKGGSVKEAEEVIATLEIRKEGEKYPAELIPVRLSEIYQINEKQRTGSCRSNKENDSSKFFFFTSPQLIHRKQTFPGVGLYRSPYSYLAGFRTYGFRTSNRHGTGERG
jgi:hypothetical protein